MLLVYFIMWLNIFYNKNVQDLVLFFEDIVIRKMINDCGVYILMLFNIYFIFVY